MLPAHSCSQPVFFVPSCEMLCGTCIVECMFKILEALMACNEEYRMHGARSTFDCRLLGDCVLWNTVEYSILWLKNVF